MISIVIPLYNKEKTIRRTIESVLQQTFGDFEIVVVNDGSTDSSLQVVNQITDSRIRLYSKENEGVSKARNFGIGMANGEWLLFLDADDLLYPNALMEMSEILTNYPEANLVAGNWDIHMPSGEVQKGCISMDYGVIKEPFKLMWKGMWNVRLGAFLVKRSCCIAINGFHEVMTIGEDTHFEKLLLLQNEVVYHNVNLMMYDQAYSSLSSQRKPFYRHIENYFLFPKTDKYLCYIEADMLFKHFFRGFIRRDLSFSYNLLKKYWKKIPFMFYVEFIKIFR